MFMGHSIYHLLIIIIIYTRNRIQGMRRIFFVYVVSGFKKKLNNE